MEIRHRKQWLTGKMIAQVVFDDGYRFDAGDSDIKLVQSLEALDASTSKLAELENKLLRSQLSEALGKIREYREDEERKQDAIKEFQDEWNKLKGPLEFMSDKFKKVQEREESGESDREYRDEIERLMAERLSDPESSVSKAVIKHFRKPDTAQPIPHHGPAHPPPRPGTGRGGGCDAGGWVRKLSNRRKAAGYRTGIRCLRTEKTISMPNYRAA